ncbi:hypothetical protein TNCV_3336551 [Trichonephila clavipes]|nr:hypothetical protein TNCV_3336551 [Trichonephila clavipes]
MGLFDFRTQGRGGQIKKARKASYSKPDVEIGVCGTQHRIPHCCAFKTNLWPAVLSFDAGRPQSISTVREYLFTVSLESFLRRLPLQLNGHDRDLVVVVADHVLSTLRLGGELVCRWLSVPKVASSTRPNSVDFHDFENRQRPCRMIMRHEKNPLSVHLAWDALGKIKFLSTNFALAELRCLPLEKKLDVKITCGNWYRLYVATLKSDTSSWGVH